VDGWAHTVRYYKTGPLLEQLENAAWYGIVKQNVLVVGCGVVWCGVVWCVMLCCKMTWYVPGLFEKETIGVLS